MLVPTPAAPSHHPHAAVPRTQKDTRLRRATWATAALAAAVWIVAATAHPAASSLIVRTRAGLTMVDPTDGRTVAVAPAGQVSADGTVATSARFSRRTGDSTVAVIDTATGEQLWTATVAGRQRVRLVGRAGQSVVVAPSSGSVDDPYRPEPRTRTQFHILSPHSSAAYSLAGNYEAEALSADGASLFLIKYTPPMDPQSYQVRRMDVASGEVLDVYTPDEELQQEMGGSARTQIASGDGNRLYTLYSLMGADGTTENFIHVLSLDGLWAHCIDLPTSFTGAPRTTSLALSDSGHRLYVVDAGAGRIAEVDTEALDVTRTAPGPAVAGPAPLVTDVAQDGRLYVATDKAVDAYEPGSLAIAEAYRAPGRVTAIQALPEGIVRLGIGRRIVVVDMAADTTVDSLSVPGGGRVDGFGTAPAPIPDERQVLDCAC